MRYGPTEYRRNNPIRVRIAPDSPEWVSVGCEQTLHRKPPLLDVVWREATPEEYKMLYERGITGIELIEPPDDSDDFEWVNTPEKPDSSVEAIRTTGYHDTTTDAEEE